MVAGFADGSKISIHAPRVGSDHRQAVPVQQQSEISIHAPRVGSDTIACADISP